MLVFRYIRLWLLATIGMLTACAPGATIATITPPSVTQEPQAFSPTQPTEADERPALIPTSPMTSSTQRAEDGATLPSLTPSHPLATPNDGLLLSPEMTTSPAASLPAAWQTFVSADLQVAVDYPPDWSVAEQPTGVTFTSPQGAIIQLGLIETGDLTPEEYFNESQFPNMRCLSKTNAYSITVRSCLDTVSRSRTADFVLQRAPGVSQLLSLTTRMRGSSEVFQMMINSVRPATQ